MTGTTAGRWTAPTGLGLAYRESGLRDGPPLLFLHGLSGSSSTYDEVRTSVDTTYRVFTLDFRGHGGSDRAPGTYQLPNYAADVSAFIEWIGRPVALAGHSLGGAVATFLAGSRPDLIAVALLEDPPLYHGDREFFEEPRSSRVSSRTERDDGGRCTTTVQDATRFEPAPLHADADGR